MSGRNDNKPALSANMRGGGKHYHIVLMAFDGVEPVDISGPSSVFARANLKSPGTYVITHAAPFKTEVLTASGLRFSGLSLLSELYSPIDTLLVAGGDAAGLRQTIFEEQVPAWLKDQSKQCRRIGSICTGAFILAAAGLLDGRRAVTHWASCSLLADLRPAVNVDRDAIYVVDGPIYTSAGVTAGIDLALKLVEEDLGSDIASEIARDMVLFLRRSGGQSQYSQLLSGQANTGENFSGLINWIADNLHNKLSIAVLAKRAGMSERTFSRAFSQETGTTPAALVRKVRIEHARRLLETTNWPIKKVAQQSGLGSEDSLVRAFRSFYNLTPRQMRLHFGSGSEN